MVLEEPGRIILDVAPQLQAAQNWEARFDVMEARFDVLSASVQQLKAEAGVLRAGADCFSAILRRSLVDDAQRKLQDLPDGLGLRREGELWTGYIARLFTERGVDWVVSKGLSVTSAFLLPKGSGTPFQEGSEAAHSLRLVNRELFDRSYLSGLSVEEQGPWQELYNFVSPTSD